MKTKARNSGAAVVVYGRRRRTGEGPTTTIVVEIGGGSSIVVAALQHLGVDVVDDDVPTLIGDGETMEKLGRLIEQRTAAALPWGFELQDTFRLLPGAIHLFRNPRIVIAFRDLLATAASEEVRGDSELVNQLAKAAMDTLAVTELLPSLLAPTLLVSYEKALSVPGELVSSLAAHVGIEPREGQRLRAIRAIESGGTSYPPTTPVWYEGLLEGSGGDRIVRGWARRMPGNEPCLIEIISNGVVIGRGLSHRAFDGEDETIRQRGFAIDVAASDGPLAARVAGTSTQLAVKPAVNRAGRRRANGAAGTSAATGTAKKAAANPKRTSSSTPARAGQRAAASSQKSRKSNALEKRSRGQRPGE